MIWLDVTPGHHGRRQVTMKGGEVARLVQTAAILRFIGRSVVSSSPTRNTRQPRVNNQKSSSIHTHYFLPSLTNNRVRRHLHMCNLQQTSPPLLSTRRIWSLRRVWMPSFPRLKTLWSASSRSATLQDTGLGWTC